MRKCIPELLEQKLRSPLFLSASASTLAVGGTFFILGLGELPLPEPAPKSQLAEDETIINPY